MSNSAYLAFETGGTRLVAGVAGPDLRLIETRTLYRTPNGTAAESFRSLVKMGHALKAAHTAKGLVFRGCGLGFGGYVRRSEQRPLTNLHEPGWEEIDVAGILEKEFGIPVRVENDCKVAALAEAHCGAGRGYRTVFYMTIGTGVGGGIVRDGRIVEMSDVGEAEIGHVVVLPDGPVCPCGNRGCVEAVCSGPGLSQLAAWLADREPQLFKSSELHSVGGGSIGGKDLMSAFSQGDAFATKVIERAASCLASAVAAAISLMAPEVFVVGGGVGSGNPAFVNLIREKTEPLVASCFRGQYSIVSSRLAEQVVTQGAAILAAQAK